MKQNLKHNQSMWTKRLSGTDNKRSKNDHRGPFERDSTRVIHAAAFRSLQNKTQIHRIGQNDFYRTRLTHSLEVASIARSIVRNIKRRQGPSINFLPNEDLITTISLLHDIGHPPFGHSGEIILNKLMADAGGFESNAQTLRLLTKVEKTYPPFGLDLTRRTLLGILKYPAPYSDLNYLTKTQKHSIKDSLPPKCYYDCDQDVIDWLLHPLSKEDKKYFQSIKHNSSGHHKTCFKSLDCSIMNIADDIAYAVHDFEDAIYLKLLDRNRIDEELFSDTIKKASEINKLSNSSVIISKLFSDIVCERKHVLGELVNFFITSIVIEIQDANFTEPLIKFHAKLPPEALKLIRLLKDTIFDLIINSESAVKQREREEEILTQYFRYKLTELSAKKNNQSMATLKRTVCDEIASLSDASISLNVI